MGSPPRDPLCPPASRRVRLQPDTHAFISGRAPAALAMRRVLPVVIIVLVGVAFTVAALTGGTGSLFVASLVAAAAMLIVVVFLVAFSRGSEPAAGAPSGGFLPFEEAARHARRGGLFDESGSEAARGSSEGAVGDAVSRDSARAFVSTLVPFPVAGSSLSTAASRKALLDALRKEGTGLVRLAKVTGVDVTPYKAFLADAREAALQGDGGASLRSLQLANELLRASIEKFLFKRRQHAPEPQGLKDR